MGNQAKVISFINEKGGIGKTSTCFNVAWEMSKRGLKVLMIDMDGQRANLTFFCGVEKGEDTLTMFNVLYGGKSIYDTIVSVKENLDLVPATTVTASLNQDAKIGRMKKAVQSVKEDYDFIFIDVNPTPNWSHVLALSSADYCVIPMLPDIASLEANKGIAESIEEVKETTNEHLKVLGLLFNKNNNNTNLSKEVARTAENMAEALESKVLKTTIRSAVAMSENVVFHMGITEYRPSSNAALDIYNLTNEILKEVEVQ